MAYLTYTEYKSYGGKLDESVFNRLEYKARKMIDKRTFGRLTTVPDVPESVKRLMYELIGLISHSDVSSPDYSPAIASEGNDGYSVSFAGSQILTVEAMEKKAVSLIEEYLEWERAEEGGYLLSCGLKAVRGKPKR